MAWIFPGGFDNGDASVWNGSAIVTQSVARGTPIIYVNFNYRIGPLGFPQGDESAVRGILNLGLKDQLAAFQWIQSNIGMFGGDNTKVTAFGSSAGAISLAVHFLDPGFSNLARAGIFESGSAATTLTNNASHGQTDWQNFISGVPSCANLTSSSDVLPCLQAADSSELLQGYTFSMAASALQFPWPPTIDGPGGILPTFPSIFLENGTFARLPFITGANLDEGTAFTATSMNSTALAQQWLYANFTPAVLGSTSLTSAVSELLGLYPDDPSLGSPFNTGNQTFGLSSQFKRVSAILGDLSFQSQRRLWIQAASSFGVKTFGYLFTDPQPQNPEFLGVTHGSEVDYVYGTFTNTSASAQKLSANIIDYWLSFVVSLDPNDGLGSQRPIWASYTPDNQVVMQLNGANLTLIPDDYRSEQISYINSQPLVFHHRR